MGRRWKVRGGRERSEKEGRERGRARLGCVQWPPSYARHWLWLWTLCVINWRPSFVKFKSPIASTVDVQKSVQCATCQIFTLKKSLKLQKTYNIAFSTFVICQELSLYECRLRLSWWRVSTEQLSVNNKKNIGLFSFDNVRTSEPSPPGAGECWTAQSWYLSHLDF